MPGTKIEASIASAETVLNSIFISGGLVLSQVCSISGIELHTVQNWVKRSYVSSPQNKKYSKRQFSRIIIINALKDVLTLDSIVTLLSHINGRLNDESDDLIDDSELYLYFIKLMSLVENNFYAIDESIDKLLEDYHEVSAGSKKRLHNVLRIMAIAYISGILKQQATLLLTQLDQN